MDVIVTVLTIDDNMDDLILETVKKLGFATVRPYQKEVIARILDKQDCLLVAKTGSGKSLVYEALPFAFDKLNGEPSKKTVIVISPLVALMRMQVKKLTSMGISAVYLQVGGFKCIIYHKLNANFYEKVKVIFCILVL